MSPTLSPSKAAFLAPLLKPGFHSSDPTVGLDRNDHTCLSLCPWPIPGRGSWAVSLASTVEQVEKKTLELEGWMVSASTDLRDPATPDSLTLSKSSLQNPGGFWELLQSELCFSVLQRMASVKPTALNLGHLT